FAERFYFCELTVGNLNVLLLISHLVSFATLLILSMFIRETGLTAMFFELFGSAFQLYGVLFSQTTNLQWTSNEYLMVVFWSISEVCMMISITLYNNFSIIEDTVSGSIQLSRAVSAGRFLCALLELYQYKQRL